MKPPLRFLTVPAQLPISVLLFLNAVSCALLAAQPRQIPRPMPAHIDDDPIQAPSDKSWEPWLARKLLPADEGAVMVRRFLEKQLEPVPLPTSREDWLARREDLRREILKVLGIDDLLPAKWDLAVQTKGTLRREGYRIEKFTFQSYPGLAISALLYLPDNIQGRVPGIVSISGHTLASKAADYVQQRNVNLALRGCVVLCYDYIGHGDRKTGDQPDRLAGRNGHDIRLFSFSPRTATALEVLDAIRAVDVLVARPEVDPERIGFTGESGGGNTTYWMAALDPRVKLAVPVCSVTSYDYWIRKDGNWDWHQRPPGIRRVADIGTLLALHAPNPLLVITSKRGTDDAEFPLAEAQKSFRWAKGVYGLLGAEPAASHCESTTGHGYQEDKRAQLYRAVEQWLQPPRSCAGKELPAPIETVEALRCPLPENNLTFRDVFTQWVSPLPRADQRQPPDALRAFLRERLGWPLPLPKVTAEKVGQADKGSWSAEFWLVESEPGIRLPAVFIRKKDAHAPITLIPGRDRSAAARALTAGRSILAFDLRCVGELRSGKGGHWARMSGAPWPDGFGDTNGELSNWAWFAGRPLAGQWALDLVQAARFCQQQLGVREVRVVAEDAFGWPALLAGAAAPENLVSGRVQIPWATLHDAIRVRGDAAMADVPGILEHLDVAQLHDLWPAGEVKVRP